MEKYIWLIPLVPFMGFLANGLGRNVFSKAIISAIGCGTVLASFLMSLGVFFEVPSGDGAQPLVFKAFDLISAPSLYVPFAFHIDALTSLFLLVVTGIGFLIHVYSTAYMYEDEGFGRFFAYLNLFIFFMLLLVMGNNFVIMFIGWEGVGLCSFLLIGFWFAKSDYVAAAKKAFVMNRIGDVGFLLAMFWMLQQFGSLEYRIVFPQIKAFASSHPEAVSILTGITLLLFLAATGKSAQVPLFTWLPDAMAGPTPVSALIHAATMVTAGIFMITRCHELFDAAPLTQSVVAWVGISTALVAATIALRQNDIKKVLAYSTVSQLGLMFAALGVGAYVGAVFHVMTHAFFKALLFLGAGSVIHGMHHEQDMSRMGGLKKYMPVTHIAMLVGCLAIAGIPGLSGFFSKDEILANLFAHNKPIYILGVLVSVMTAFYMFRLYAMTFLGSLRSSDAHPHESPAAMTVPLMVLAVLAVAGGYLGIPTLFKEDAHLLSGFLSGVLGDNIAENSEYLHHHVSHAEEWALMAALFALSAAAIVWAWKKYSSGPDGESSGIMKWFEDKWYVDELYGASVIRPLQHVADLFKVYVEKAGIRSFVSEVGSGSVFAGLKIKRIQTGNVGLYVLAMTAAVLAYILIFFFYQ